MILQDDIPPSAELFTAWLGTKTEPSFFTFGYIDAHALAAQTPTYTPVDPSRGFWEFDSTLAAINGDLYDRSGNKAMADTGTTLCLVSDALCARIYSTIPGATMSATQQGWVFPTPTNPATLPTISLSVGASALFTLKPENFAFQDLGDGTTYGGVQSRGKQDFDVLGCVFLRSVYAVFDQGNSRFGCVQRPLPLGVQQYPPPPLQQTGKLLELDPVPTDELPMGKPRRKRGRFGFLGCCRREGTGSGDDVGGPDLV